MNATRRSLVLVAVAALLSIASCGKEQPPPPPPKVEAPPPPPPPTVDADTQRLASEVYIYAFPMVLMDVTREVQTARTPAETFAHKRTTADFASTEITSANPDFLYSQAWIDLSKQPIVLSVPDTRGRYYLIAMLDAFTNVAASIGKRTTGSEKGDFAIVGPRWKGTLPAGVSEIRSPTEMAWLLGRIKTSGRADDAAAAKVQDQLKLAPLGKRTGKGGAPAPTPVHANVDLKTDPRDQVARMDPATFFTRFAMLLPGNPPAKEDATMIAKIKKLGIVAGQPLDVSKLDPLVATSVNEGIKSAREAIIKAGKGGGSADVRNGWKIDRDLGRWGADYGRRAVNAWRGLGVNAPEDAIFMTAQFDGGGRKLDGANRYVLRFNRANVPPVDGFWSVTLYDENGRFVANRLNRNHLQSDEVKTNADGSIDIAIQNADPGADKESNWLPAPKGGFNVVIRTYWPKQELLDGRWVPPGIKQAG